MINPRNGGFWAFYGMMAALMVGTIGAIVYGTLFVRPADIEAIRQTKHQADITKKALDDAMAGKWPEAYHRSHHKEWCIAMEQANPGLTCIDPYSLPSYTGKR